MEKFAQRLKELRADKELSTAALGKLVGVESSTISRWENNKIAIIDENLVKLSKFFGVTTDYLLGLED